ncbi:helix-turn-helix domain-containing protein [Rhizobium mayense]|uniref:Helix-turn-helix domain-containing protein n=1 Tax=Rhizobium mayense TaxID=1312184 RepID=A0ABT7JR49_9HYPH|nr:helix-turn-helix domain-containing protein [Rhizobium mayense]MDL2398741.1 helix-turn-helix domain-containing protein [Rhizobium mayense]
MLPDSPQNGHSPPVPVERRRWPRSSDTAQEASPPLPPALEPLRFSTRGLPLSDQFAAWQAYLAPLIDIRLPDGASDDAGFPADHTAWNLGGMLVVQQSVPAHSYVRSAAKLRSNSIDHWHVVLLRSGRSWTEVDGKVSEGGPGKVELRSLGHPFRGRATDSQSLSFYLPRELFLDTTAVNDIKNNMVFSDTYINLLIDYLGSLEAKLASMTAPDLPRVVQTTRDMLVTCLSSPAGSSGPEKAQSNLALMERVRRFVQQNLGSQNLTPDTISRELGISRTRLYQLFESSGGVLHYIQKRRLFSAHVALSDTVNRQQILEIATAVGFTSAAHFSRAFSKEFGYTPREARNVAAPAFLARTVSSVDVKDSSNPFGNWLNSLGH